MSTIASILNLLSHPSKLATSWLLCLVPVIFIIGRIFYRFTFHPLAKYPGPVLARASSLYAAYHAWRGDLHLDIARCHKKYGDYVRYAPDRVIANSVCALHDIYGYNKNVRKGKSYLPMVPGRDGWTTMTLIDKKLHQQRRKIVSKPLSESTLREHVPEMITHIDTFLENLRRSSSLKDWSSPQDMSTLCMRLTLDITADFFFDQKTALQIDRNLDFIRDIIQNYSWRMGIYEQCPELRYLNVENILSLLGVGAKLKTRFDSWSDEFASDALDRRQRRKKGQFSLIRDFKFPSGHGLSDETLLAEGSLIMLAGTETSAIAMSAIFFYLVKNPKVYERLAHEIRTTFTDIDDVTAGDKLQSCEFLSACILEAMRISPPVPGVPWREVERGGITIDGRYNIPESYSVGTSIYAIHHNPEYFRDPDEYKPSRWMESDTPKEEIDIAYTAFNPFSIGSRGCLGRAMAMLEINLVIARTLFSFDFRLDDESLATVESGSDNISQTSEFRLYSQVTSSCKGPWLMFKER